MIIAVRNEEHTILNLLRDLNHQDYPFQNFEVIVIDDFSTDKTCEIIRDYHPAYNLQLLSLPEPFRHFSNKKRAISQGIDLSTGELIISTDGDCRVGSKWLSSMEYVYAHQGAKMITGPVTFFSSGNIFKQMQTIEFASLIGSGAASLNLGYPNMCNGANLAYEKKVFYEVKGYEGFENIASGDDEFLMHKIYEKYPGKVVFLKSREAIVTTEAKVNLRDFANQRKRWASKWGHYRIKSIKLLAFFIFLYNLSLLAMVIMTLTGDFPPIILLEQILIKICIEFVFLKRVLGFFGKKMQFFTFYLLQMVHPFYITFFALSSLSGKYEWKGRNLKPLKIDRPGI